MLKAINFSLSFLLIQGSDPFPETNFKDVSRTQIDSSRASISPYTLSFPTFVNQFSLRSENIFL